MNDASHVAGLHLNFCLAGPPAGVKDPNEGVPPSRARAHARPSGLLRDRDAATSEQSTKPQTVGYGLDDSPAGLAAWIVEKFRSWCDCDGNVERKFTKDDLLTNIMLYWVDPVGGIIGADLLRESARGRSAAPRGGAHGLRGVPEGDQHPATTLGGSRAQPDALDTVANSLYAGCPAYRLFGVSSG